MSNITRIIWDNPLQYEIGGLDRGVFYSPDGIGEVWNGLVSVIEASSDSDSKMQYIDGVKNYHRRKVEPFSGIIEAYSCPKAFYDNILNHILRDRFGFSYRVMTYKGYKIHLIYNVFISPSAFLYSQTDVDKLSWNFTTLPIPIPGARLSSHLIIDTSIAYSWTVTALEDILYGSDTQISRLPSPQEVFDIFEGNSILQIIDNGDGTWTAIGPNSAIQMIDSTTFEITWPSAIYIDEVSYTISSL